MAEKSLVPSPLPEVQKSVLEKTRYKEIVGCTSCGIPIRRHKFELKKYKSFFCSMPCRAKWLSLNNSGKNHPRWNGGIRNHSQGYLVAWDGPNKRILHHRKVVELNLGRKLLPSEIIHHKNGNKKDNRIENLEITDLVKHQLHHAHERATWVNCGWCNKSIQVSPSAIKRIKLSKRCCSQSHSRKLMIKMGVLIGAKPDPRNRPLCFVCGKEFKINAGRRLTAKTCSMLCWKVYKKMEKVL